MRFRFIPLHPTPVVLLLILALSNTPIIFTQDSSTIVLPKPHMDGGKPLMQVLKKRRSSREFSTKKLPLNVLSDMLWAAWGINRSDTGRRTAPSMANRQTIDLYAASADGLFLYDAKKHCLIKILDKDIRAITGRQSFVKDAPVSLIYVADYSRMGKMADEQKHILSAADTGYISQNVYLYCASEELATVVFHSINKPELEREMGLRADQRVTLAQSVGYPCQ